MSELWFPFRRPSAAPRLRLVCFAHAGGGAAVFREWPNELPHWVEVAGVQLPGHETRLREPLVASVPPLAHAIAAALAELPPLPCALYGHSYGAVLAYAVARELQQSGAPATRLFLAGGEAPHTPRLAPLSHLQSDERLIARLAGIGGTPDKLFDHPEMRALFLPVLRADLEASESFTCTREEQIDAPFTVLGGTRDDAVDPERLKRWPELSRGGAEFAWFEGSHFFPRERRGEVLARISAVLAAPVRP
jgi:myxalamid-type polyketide synthase MxaE and MxaD